MINRMDAELRRRKSEDQPALAGVDVRKTEDVAQSGARRPGVGGIDQDVGANERRARICTFAVTG
jgi:hypothetical protein